MIKRFYNVNGETVRNKNKQDFFIKNNEYGNPMLYVKDERGNTYQLTYYKGGLLEFYKFSTLKNNYSVDFIRYVLEVDDYKFSKGMKESREKFQRMLKKGPVRELNNIEIPSKEITSQQEAQELLETTIITEKIFNDIESFASEYNLVHRETQRRINEETSVKEVETSLINAETQTNVDMREMSGLMKAYTTIQEEIALQLPRLYEKNRKIEEKKKELRLAKLEKNEDKINKLRKELIDLEIERSAILEVINIHRDKIRNQLNRIKETIRKILYEDTTLGERIRTLFREQGIIIVSVLTAFGMIIGFIVDAIIPSGSGSSPPPPPPSDKTDAKDWIKKQLKNLGKLLAKLAGKAASALPGIIGAIVSWLLKTTGSIINWVANNLWALLVLVVGLLYAAAREYLK